MPTNGCNDYIIPSTTQQVSGSACSTTYFLSEALFQDVILPSINSTILIGGASLLNSLGEILPPSVDSTIQVGQLQDIFNTLTFIYPPGVDSTIQVGQAQSLINTLQFIAPPGVDSTIQVGQAQEIINTTQFIEPPSVDSTIQVGQVQSITNLLQFIEPPGVDSTIQTAADSITIPLFIAVTAGVDATIQVGGGGAISPVLSVEVVGVDETMQVGTPELDTGLSITAPSNANPLAGNTQELFVDFGSRGQPITWSISIPSSSYTSGNIAGTELSHIINPFPDDGSSPVVNVSAVYPSETLTTTITYNTFDALAIPGIDSPTPGSTFANDSQQFHWVDHGANASNYTLSVGTAYAGNDLYQGTTGSVTSDASGWHETVNNLPDDGSLVYVNLSFILSGVPHVAHYVYTATYLQAILVNTFISTPQHPGSQHILTGRTHNFQWLPRGDEADITGWVLKVKARQNFTAHNGVSWSIGDELLSVAAPANVLSYTWSGPGVPFNYEKLTVELTHDVGVITRNDINAHDSRPFFTAINGGLGTVTTSTFDVSYDPDLHDVSSWAIQAYSASQPSTPFYSSGVIQGGTLTDTIQNTITDGSNITVTLSWTAGSGDYSSSRSVTLATLGLPRITAPSTAHRLHVNNTFQWSPEGLTVTDWQLVVTDWDSSAVQYRDTGVVTAPTLSTTVNGIPTDGRRIRARLYYRVAGVWDHRDFSYYAPQPEPYLSSPGYDITATNQTFIWNNNGDPVTNWQWSLGTTPNATDVYDSGILPSSTVSYTHPAFTPDTDLYRYGLLRWSLDGGATWLSRAYNFRLQHQGRCWLGRSGSFDSQVTTTWIDRDTHPDSFSLVYTYTDDNTQVLDEGNVNPNVTLANTVHTHSFVGPANGRPFKVEVTYPQGAVVRKYTCYNSMTAPVEPKLLTPSSGVNYIFKHLTQEVTWDDGTMDNLITGWKIHLGTAVNPTLYYSSPLLPAIDKAHTVSGYPDDGSIISVRLEWFT